MARLFIGIESVGTRNCVAVVSDASGRLLGAVRKIGKPLAVHTVADRDFRIRLNRIIVDLCTDAGITNADLSDSYICLTLSGVNSKLESDFIIPQQLQHMELPYSRLRCVGDVEAVFVSHAKSATGSAIVSGLGSVAYAQRAGQSRRVGGWGSFIGDGGSGFGIGQLALRSIARDVDREAPFSILWNNIESWLVSLNSSNARQLELMAPIWRRVLDQLVAKRVDVRHAIVAFTHSTQFIDQMEWRVAISSLASPVFDAWRSGCPEAKKIIDFAVGSLVQQHKVVINLAGFSNSVPETVLFGGVINHNADFRDLLENQLRESEELTSVDSLHTLRPVFGALLLAMQMEGIDPFGRMKQILREQISIPRFADILKND